MNPESHDSAGRTHRPFCGVGRFLVPLIAWLAALGVGAVLAPIQGGTPYWAAMDGDLFKALAIPVAIWTTLAAAGVGVQVLVSGYGWCAQVVVASWIAVSSAIAWFLWILLLDDIFPGSPGSDLGLRYALANLLIFAVAVTIAVIRTLFRGARVRAKRDP